MDVITATRELGKALQADERYINYKKCNDANDNDEALQAMINEFNLKRINLNSKVRGKDNDPNEIADLNAEVKALYEKLMTNENMAMFQAAKTEFDDLLSQIDTVINYSANGEDPETCPTTSSCGGSCSSCAGCH
ncbi:MAG: YlbF family regulator [Oscillospiraceae bacterium]|jgi:cell fate (sporulation/competence/biofilm development) regulator YlbF (YheA/YmcA/DUF963 family)|nr:YlbF family regulator [Oscillospiraceae bacterium]